MKRIIMAGGLFFCLCFMEACARDEVLRTEKPYDTAVFSWNKQELEKGHREALFSVMDEAEVTAVYQSFSDEVSEVARLEFLKEAGKEEKSVYLLTGDPKWALDSKGKKLKDKLSEAERLNKKAGSKGKIKGVVFDVEPYLLDEWKDNSRYVMETYVAGMIQAHKEARKRGLELVACIPYHYDSQGLEQQLKRLVEKGCDTVAVMNYNRQDEYSQIKTEIDLAKEYGKGILSLYELQKPGQHELTQNNTYHGMGLGGVKESFGKLKESASYEKLGYGLHDYKSLREMLGYE